MFRVNRQLFRHFFTTGLKGISHDDVMSEICKLIDIHDVLSIQITGKDCIVTLKNPETKDRLATQGTPLRDRSIKLYEVESSITHVTIKDMPYEKTIATFALRCLGHARSDCEQYKQETEKKELGSYGPEIFKGRQDSTNNIYTDEGDEEYISSDNANCEKETMCVLLGASNLFFKEMELFSGFIAKAILIFIVTYVFWRLWKFANKYKEWRKVTSQTSVIGPLHPLWGSLHKFKDLAEFMTLVREIISKERSKVVGYWFMFFFPEFNVVHPDSVRILMKSSEPKAIGCGGFYRMMKSWLGDGLLISSGKKWERNRRLITPAFHFGILKPYVDIYNSSTDKFLDNLKGFAQTSKPVDIFPLVSLETLDTILRCAFSYEGNIQTKGKPWLYWDTIYYMTPKGREYRKICQYVHDFSEGVIRERQQTFLTDGPPTSRHLDFLDILLTAKDDNEIGLSFEDIRAEVDTFLFEGHDTTASAISWAIYHLGKHQKEQEIIYSELSELLNDKKQVSWENLQIMPKLTAFIKESMRMVAPVPNVQRQLTSPITIDNVTIPAGVVVDMGIYMLHHHPDVWPDNDVFRPERFLQEDIAERHPYSFLPFAAGSRNCIGQNFAMDEIKVVLARLIQRYKVFLVPDHKYEIKPELVMRSKYGINITVEERK
ncbi:CYP4B1 [Mytilus coruscus]|uniref:CYP4B1 n=1 Tax=Mytilus coruscus TaxID=42192 RepID=A0A6J8EH87_MYTCO|nr:CYP4B1 [Mytilus coruscus]